MIRIKSKTGLLIAIIIFIADIWIDGNLIDRLFNTGEVVGVGFFLFGLLCKIERFMLWNHSDKWSKAKKNGHS